MVVAKGARNGIDPEPEAPPGVLVKSFDAEAGPEECAQLSRAVRAAKLEVPIDRHYPIARAADVHRERARAKSFRA